MGKKLRTLWTFIDLA